MLTIVVIFQATGNPAEPSQTATAELDTVGASAAAAGPTGPARATSRTDSTVDTQPSTPDQAAAPAVPDAVPDLTIRDADGHPAASITAGALPAGDPFVAAGAGTWHVVPGTTATQGTGDQQYTYTVEVEDGLRSVEQDQAFAADIDAILADPRSWIGGGQVSLTRIDTGDPDFRISLTSQLTIRSPDKCGWEVPLEASCFNGWAGRVLINDARWVRGAMSYGADLAGYRTYAVNHEVGHALGHRHEACPGPAATAPVMMQQSWSISDDDLSVLDPQTVPRDGNVCLANPYPFPAAATPAPSDPAPTAAAG